MNQAGLLARLTSVGLLILYFPQVRKDNGLLDKSVSNSDNFLEWTDLQLRGQLRYYTGFPINPRRLKASGNLFRLQT